MQCVGRKQSFLVLHHVVCIANTGCGGWSKQTWLRFIGIPYDLHCFWGGILVWWTPHAYLQGFHAAFTNRNATKSLIVVVTFILEKPGRITCTLIGSGGPASWPKHRACYLCQEWPVRISTGPTTVPILLVVGLSPVRQIPALSLSLSLSLCRYRTFSSQTFGTTASVAGTVFTVVNTEERRTYTDNTSGIWNHDSCARAVEFVTSRTPHRRGDQMSR